MTDLIGKSLGRYHILEQLGEGGMATVYKAYDTRLETDVAVKVIRTETLAPTVLERALKRFEREAKSLARLTHPNIVKVTDYGEHEGKPYLVMTYLLGGTLKQRLGKSLPWQEAARLLHPIARALDYAHRQNMIHRDVKPSNILITADGEPMLTDFGIAKILDLEETADLTGTGMGIGTPEYMAPEQWTGQTTQQSDQYSLGVVLYEMLTGRRPYTADTPAAILLKQANEPLPRPRQFARDLPDKVEKLILKAMAKNPADRYASMGAFASALEGLVISERSSVISEQSSGIGKKGEAEQTPKREQAKMVAKEKIERKTPPVPIGGVKKQWSSLLRYWPVMGGLALVVVCLWFFGNLLWKEGILLTFLSPPLPTYTPVAGTLQNEITDSQGVTMRLIPAGMFKMGSDNGAADGKPVHEVFLDAYYMDVYEVTNKFYKVCVTAGVCDSPTNSALYNDSEYESHPVVYVDWDMAKTYCEWRGAALPTEAQWEKAARGTNGRTYPWGEGIDPTRANISSVQAEVKKGDNPDSKTIHVVNTTTEVGSYPLDVSPYGMYDMAGNVWEWVMDWYNGTFYASSPLSNPVGPDIGKYRVFRGGSWFIVVNFARANPDSFSNEDFDDLARSANRYGYDPTYADLNLGFRCARPVDAFALSTTTPPPAATSISTQVSLPEEIADSQGVTMRLVPAGTFTMGSDSGDADEKPVHDVYLDSFYMDVYEVTNGLYKTCVDAGMCNPPKQSNSYSRSSYFGNSEFDHYPVIYVDPDMAQTYCAWRGGGLPSEAQWEKAARGTDSRAYPWGGKVDCVHANYASCSGETSAVGMFPDGVSPYGLFDMSGNVLEWVADWYDTAYYENSPLNNPLGPSSGKYHVLRGGSWKSLTTGVRSSDRLAITPDLTNYYLIGFRCARPAP